MKFLIALTVVASSSFALTNTFDISGRITNGEFAVVKQFPYQAGLKLYFGDEFSWCGGTLLSDRWILTAAHCTKDATGVDVYLGATNKLDRNEVGQQVIYVGKKNIINHNNWNETTITNDIALIKLPVSIEFNDYIQPARLPKKSSISNTYAGEKAIASGWGRFSDEIHYNSDKLRWIRVPVITNTDCVKYFPKVIHPSNICISTKGKKSPCHSDSGGPLVLADGSITVIGITSFGYFLCENDYPAVFTRTSYFLDWIMEHTGIGSI